jgi:hypothetical protein
MGLDLRQIGRRTASVPSVSTFVARPFLPSGGLLAHDKVANANVAFAKSMAYM